MCLRDLLHAGIPYRLHPDAHDQLPSLSQMLAQSGLPEQAQPSQGRQSPGLSRGALRGVRGFDPRQSAWRQPLGGK